MIDLPHPAAEAVRDLERRSADGERLDALGLAFESLLRVECAVGAACFLASEAKRDDRIRRLLTLSRYHLGDWYSLLQGLVSLGCTSEETSRWFRALEHCDGGACLLRLVEIRNLRAHDDRRMMPEFVRALLDEALPLFDRCWTLRGELPSFGDDGGRVVVLGRDGTHADAGPLLLSGRLVGRPRELLMYRAATSNSLGYTTRTGKEYWCRETFAFVSERLRRKVSLLEHVDADGIPDILAERVSAVTDQTLRRFEGVRRYRPDIWVDRSELDCILHAFLGGEARVLVLEGPPGSGRTAWLCASAARRRREGALTLLESADRLAGRDFLDGLSATLRVRGELGNALERLGDSSTDGVVALFIHDLSSPRDGEDLLLSLFRWSERMRPDSPVRVVVTVASDWWRSAVARTETSIPSSCLRVAAIPPLRVDEIEALAARVANASGALASSRDHTARRELARRLAAIGNASARRPALALSILELAGGASAPESLSARAVYEQVFARDVLAVNAQKVARFPLRGALVRRVAAAQLARGETELPLEELVADVSGLIDASGQRSVDYEALLASGIFVEGVEEFSSTLSFADTGLLEYAAALDRPLQGLAAQLGGLVERASSFELMLGVAGHLLLRAAARGGTRALQEALGGLSNEGARRVLVAMALRDADAFVAAIPALATDMSTVLLEATEQLLDVLGESRTAASASAALTRATTDDRERCAWAWSVRLHALYMLDEYDLAEKELRDAEVDKTPRFLATLADFASSRRDFARAEETFRELLAVLPTEPSLERAIALRGLGYVEMETGRLADARATLERALAMMRGDEDHRHLAEVWSELGELAMREGRLDAARAAFEASKAINRRMGSLIGLGIVEGLFGELDLRAGQVDDAEQHLGAALTIHRRVANQWREAWTLRRLAWARNLRGDAAGAAGYECEASALEQSMGFVTTDPTSPSLAP